MFTRLLRTKTFWCAVAAIVTVAEQFATGKATLTQGLQILVPSLLAIFVRDGIAKTDAAMTDITGKNTAS